MLKEKTAFEIAESSIQTDTIAEFVSEHTVQEVNFGKVRATLPQLVTQSSALVKVKNRHSGTFYAVSEQGLNQLVTEAIAHQHSRCCVFDGMESFHSDEPIGLAVLDDLDARAVEFTESDIATLATSSQ